MKSVCGLSAGQADASSVEVFSPESKPAPPGFVVVPAPELERLREVEASVEVRIKRIERAAQTAIREAEAAVETAKREVGSLVFRAAFEAARNAGLVTELDRDALRALYLTDEKAALTAMEIEWRTAR